MGLKKNRLNVPAAMMKLSLGKHGKDTKILIIFAWRMVNMGVNMSTWSDAGDLHATEVRLAYYYNFLEGMKWGNSLLGPLLTTLPKYYTFYSYKFRIH